MPSVSSPRWPSLRRKPSRACTASSRSKVGSAREIAVGVAAQHAVVEAERVEADHEVRRGELREQGLDVGLAEGVEALLRAVPGDGEREPHQVRVVPAADVVGAALRLEVEDDDARRGLGLCGGQRHRRGPRRPERRAAAGSASVRSPSSRSSASRAPALSIGRLPFPQRGEWTQPGQPASQAQSARRSRVASSSASMRSHRPAARPRPPSWPS